MFIFRFCICSLNAFVSLTPFYGQNFFEKSSERKRWVKVSFPNIHYLRAENLHQGDTNLMSQFEGVIEGVGKDIKEKQAAILCVLHEQPGLRTTRLSSKTDIPVKSIE